MGTRMITSTIEGAQMSTKKIAARAALAACLAWMAAFPALATNTLKDVRYAPAADGKVDITFEFAEPIGAVNAFTTDTPPRIAIDFPDTGNAFDARRLVVGSGAASAVSVVEAGGRTRAVVDLFRTAGYTTRSEGNLLVLSSRAVRRPTRGRRAWPRRIRPSASIRGSASRRSISAAGKMVPVR